MVRVGAGIRVYEQLETWENLPEGWVLGQTAIVTDSQDRVYLFNRGDHPLIVLDRDGNFLNSWGEGQLPDAHGMFIDADDNLYMPVKNSHVVLKYRPDGNLLMTLGEWDKPSDTGWSGDYSDSSRLWTSSLRAEVDTRALQQVILPTAPGVSNEGGSSPLLVPLPAVSWPWVPACGSLEPPRRDGENAQKTGKTGNNWARYGLRSVNKEGTGGITWRRRRVRGSS